MESKYKSEWSPSNISTGEWASLGLSGISSLASYDSIKTDSKFESDQHLFNAGLADRAAKDAIRRGEKQVDDIRRRTKQLVGEQRAAFAAQGIDVGDGSAIDLQEDSNYWGAYDEMQTRNNAFLESYGMKMQALNLRSQAKATELSGDYKARLTLISGIADMGTKAAKAGAGG